MEEKELEIDEWRGSVAVWSGEEKALFGGVMKCRRGQILPLKKF